MLVRQEMSILEQTLVEGGSPTMPDLKSTNNGL